MTPLRHSKAVEEIGYDRATNTLRVRFRQGGLYDYFAVPVEIHEGLLTSEPPWSEWRDRVQMHPFQRLE